MLALSPPLFSTTFKLPLEDLITQNLQQNYNDIEVEENSYYSPLDFPSFEQIQHDFAPANSGSSGGVINSCTGDPMMLTKKLNHNASERDRRKRVNDLYAYLLSLLPVSSNQKKKVSIPGTVSRALKYIPELQKELDILIRKKEKLLSYSSSTDITRQDHLQMRNQRTKDAMVQTLSSVVSSVSVLDEKEVVIQLMSSAGHMNKSKDIGFLSKALEYLEEEENGLVLLNASAFECFGGERLLNTLHLKVLGDQRIEVEMLKEKLFSFYKRSHRLVC